jgi:hypothetical protein
MTNKVRRNNASNAMADPDCFVRESLTSGSTYLNQQRYLGRQAHWGIQASSRANLTAEGKQSHGILAGSSK